MVVGLGIDLIAVEKIARLARRESFLRRVYSDRERAETAALRDPAASLAGKFAAKEACLKALGLGLGQGLTLLDMEVLKGPDGAPGIVLSPRAAGRLAALGGTRVHVSLSHSAGLAVAVVVLEA